MRSCRKGYFRLNTEALILFKSSKAGGSEGDGSTSQGCVVYPAFGLRFRGDASIRSPRLPAGDQCSHPAIAPLYPGGTAAVRFSLCFSALPRCHEDACGGSFLPFSSWHLLHAAVNALFHGRTPYYPHPGGAAFLHLPHPGRRPELPAGAPKTVAIDCCRRGRLLHGCTADPGGNLGQR